MAEKQEEAITFMQQKLARTKKGVLCLNEMHDEPPKIAGVNDYVDNMKKEEEAKIEPLTQQIVQINEDYVKVKNLIARVDSLRDKFQFKVDECKKELKKQRKK